jgi:hypothetical protein
MREAADKISTAAKRSRAQERPQQTSHPHPRQQKSASPSRGGSRAKSKPPEPARKKPDRERIEAKREQHDEDEVDWGGSRGASSSEPRRKQPPQQTKRVLLVPSIPAKSRPARALTAQGRGSVKGEAKHEIEEKEEEVSDNEARRQSPETSVSSSEAWGPHWKGDIKKQPREPDHTGHKLDEHLHPKKRRGNNPQEVCRFFSKRGWCRFGAKCDFRHVGTGEQATDTDRVTGGYSSQQMYESRKPYHHMDVKEGKLLVQLLRRDNSEWPGGKAMDSEGFRALDDVAKQANIPPWRVLDVVQKNHRFEVRFHSICNQPTQPFIRALAKHHFHVHTEQPDLQQ